MKLLFDKLQINLSAQATEVLCKLANDEGGSDKTPFENRMCSRFLSNTKSTQDKTFDTNSVKKKNFKM